jgi:hypothetical protein
MGEGATGGGQWFCHALTGGKDLLDVLLRIPRGSFDAAKLGQRLGIKTLDERTDLPVYGQAPRVMVRRRSDSWDEIRIGLRDFTDVRKRVFGAFLNEAASAYADHFATEQDDPSQAAPWRTDGQAWHLSQKSIGARHDIKWKPAVLPAVIGLFRKLQPDLEPDYSAKVLVTLYVPGEERYAARIITNMAAGLRVELRAPPGEVTPVQCDRLGFDVEIRRRGRGEYIVFWTRSLDGIDARQLADVWRRCRPSHAEGRLRSA